MRGASAAERTARADALMREAFPLHEAGDVDAAGRLYEQILELAPEYADAHYLLGCIALARGEPEAAARMVRQALRYKDDEASFHQTLAECYAARQLWDETVVYYENALRLDPAAPRVWNELGIALRELGRYDAAAHALETAATRDPDLAQAHYNLGNVRRDMGDVDGSLAALRRARELAPDNPMVASSHLFTLNLSTRHDRDAVFREHCAFDARFGAARHAVPQPPAADADPDRRLKVAYFSPDLRAHPVSAFLAPVLAHHDRARFEVACYHLHAAEDAVSERLRSLCDRWVSCAGESDGAIADALRADGIDLVVDLAGHTAGNRLPVLARKPAPVIATWLGYLNTTGLAAVDYRITDAFCDPPGSERWHRERLVRLPAGHSCFEAPDLDVPVDALPALARGAVRFGSFNKAAKLTEPMLATWARILAAVPGSSLLLAGVGAGQGERIRRLLQAQGVAPARIEILDRLPLQAMLEAHRDVDIALDTSPYNGTTTTFNSLWMGVPVVTLAGAAPVSRSCGGILSVLGLADWVATTPEGYVEAAVRQATDHEALARLRAGLRERLRQSALMDAPRFTAGLEAAYRGMWQTYCDSPSEVRR